MEEVNDREKETSAYCETARRRARQAHSAFEKVKSERYQRFQDFFEPVSSRIDDIYKVMSMQLLHSPSQRRLAEAVTKRERAGIPRPCKPRGAFPRWHQLQLHRTRQTLPADG